ncbi:Calcium-activated potassium channel subunit alpha-1 [Lamellibrachia satsuma]|nr:Calcium-activated potassium channel subunit alpha-1 [Lamellibrachia satsuma]
MVRMLTTGASVVEYEQILADGLGLIRQQSLVDVSAARNRCRVAQLDLGDGRFAQLEHNNRYGRLFVQALNRYGILCLGLYRVMELSEDSGRPSRRYVMTHPPPSVNLLPSDKVFVLEPYHLEQTSSSMAGSCVASSTASPVLSHKSSRRCKSRDDRPPRYTECSGLTGRAGCVADRNWLGRSKKSTKTLASCARVSECSQTTHV